MPSVQNFIKQSYATDCDPTCIVMKTRLISTAVFLLSVTEH